MIETEKVILIASAKTRKEIPFYYRIVGLLKLHRLLPANILKQSNPLVRWFFGVKTLPERKLLKAILDDTDPTFLKWAIDKALSWKNETLLKNIFHIYGTADKILPLKFVNCDVEITNGGHLMTLNAAKEISTMIKCHLEDH